MNKSYYRVLVFNLDKFMLWPLTGVDGSSKCVLKMFSSLFSSLEYHLFLWDLASAYILITTRAAILKSS